MSKFKHKQQGPIKEQKKPVQKTSVEQIPTQSPKAAPSPNIRITVISAEILQGIEEGGGKMDPYVKMRYATEDMQNLFEHKTKVDMNADLNPKWDQAFEVRIEDFTHNLYFEIWEWDKDTADDYLGIGKIALESTLAYDGKPFELALQRKEQSYGTITLRVERMADENVKDEAAEIRHDSDVERLRIYLWDTGLERAFKLIFTEIITRKIDRNDVFHYTALRLRQIGNDLKPFIQKPQNLSQILNNINEVEADDNIEGNDEVNEFAENN